MTGRRGQGECRGAGRGAPHLAASWARSLPSPPRAAPPLRRRNKGRGRAGGGPQSPAHRSSSRPPAGAQRRSRASAVGAPGRRRGDAVGARRGHGVLAVADRRAAAAPARRAAEPLGQVLRQDHAVLRALPLGLHGGRGHLPAAPPRPDSGEHEARGPGVRGGAAGRAGRGGAGTAPTGGTAGGGAGTAPGRGGPPPASAFLTFFSPVPPSAPPVALGALGRRARVRGTSRHNVPVPGPGGSGPGADTEGLQKVSVSSAAASFRPAKGPAGGAGRWGRRLGVAERPWAGWERRSPAPPAGKERVGLRGLPQGGFAGAPPRPGRGALEPRGSLPSLHPLSPTRTCDRPWG